MSKLTPSTFPAKKVRVAVLLSLLGIALVGLVFKIYTSYTTGRDPIHPNFRPVMINDASALIDERDGKKWMYGGSRETEKDFDVTSLDLNPGQFHYGIGRENFPALIEPEFVAANEASKWLGDNDVVLAVKVKDEVKVYPVKLLLRHEIVNDVIGGRPIFAAYCYLAELGAVYDRDYAGETLTFGLSGYTYFDPEIWDGRDAFVFWDRETESLWWPPIGKAVSGSLNGVELKLLEPELWSQSKWGEIQSEYPNALVLKAGQGFTPPEEWPSLDEETVALIKREDVEQSIAPRWGGNTAIGEGLQPAEKDSSVPMGSGTWR